MEWTSSSHARDIAKIDFENVDIITKEKSYWRRLIQEGLEIKQLGNENRANLQAGYEINECWDPILKKKI